MPKKVFVSYSHRQGEWVWDRLVPVLRAGGLEVLIDRERFVAGKDLFPQMDATQDQAEVDLLVLSPEYLASDACRHELDRAVARDTPLPVIRESCPLPDSIRGPNKLYVDLKDDREREPWDLLVRTLDSPLGAPAPAWLAARDQVSRPWPIWAPGSSRSRPTPPGSRARPSSDIARRAAHGGT